MKFIFLLLSVLGCNSSQKGEKDIALNLVAKNSIYKESQIKCDSISKATNVEHKLYFGVSTYTLDLEDSINRWQTVRLICRESDFLGPNEEILFTIKVDTTNKKIEKIYSGEHFIKR